MTSSRSAVGRVWLGVRRGKPFGSESTTYGASVPGARIGDDPRLAVVEVDRVLVLVEPGIQPARPGGPHRPFRVWLAGKWNAAREIPDREQFLWQRIKSEKHP